MPRSKNKNATLNLIKKIQQDENIRGKKFLLDLLKDE